jgi:alanyl-tRNA synthetase
MGGQNGDTGVIKTENGTFVVTETIHLAGTKVGHVGYMSAGMIKSGDTVTMEVDAVKRAQTCANHSATHLLQKALKTVLGNHVEQKGSFVSPDRLRFDFSHFEAMTAEELERVEEIVNQEITAALPVETQILNIEEARKTGAMALFGEKYGETVRVVCMGEFSKEFCGGTHVANTSAISAFKIISEAGVAAGVRRIEALTGAGLMHYYANLEKTLNEAAKAAKTSPASLTEKITTLQEEIKALRSENESLKSKLANSAMGDVMSKVVDVKGVKVLPVDVAGVDMNGLRNLGDQLKEQLGEGVIVLASADGEKVNLLAMATDEAQKKGVHAGNLIKAIAGLVGGGGGGRPNMAQAGGKNPAGISAALEKASQVVAEQVK